MKITTRELSDDPVRAVPEEGDALEALRRLLDGIVREHRSARLVDASGETAEVPASALRALMHVVQEMTRDRATAFVPLSRELTTQEAADLLHVSRPHLVKLLDEGAIDHYKVGSHRRVRVEDVLAYREARGGRRREQLDELTRLSEDLEGGYR